MKTRRYKIDTFNSFDSYRAIIKRSKLQRRLDQADSDEAKLRERVRALHLMPIYRETTAKLWHLYNSTPSDKNNALGRLYDRLKITHCKTRIIVNQIQRKIGI